MSDKVNEARRQAQSWLPGSRTRETLEHRAKVLEIAERVRLSSMEVWLDVEWKWLEANADDPRYEDREERWLDALSRYEKAVKKLEGSLV